MASVLSVRQLAGREAQFTSKFGRRYSLEWEVHTDDPAIDPLLVQAATGIPRRGEAATGWGIADPYALALEAKAKQDAVNKRVWRVTCTFSNEWDVGSGGVGGKGANSADGGVSTNPNLPENPLDEPAVYEYESVDERVPLLEDKDSNAPVLNTAGDPFDSPVMEERAITQITYRKNMPLFNAMAWRSLVKTVNEDPIKILPDDETFQSGTVWLKSYKASIKQYRNGVEFFTITATFWYRADGWSTRVFNLGYRQMVGTNKVQITDYNGNPVNSPRMLDALGRVLIDGEYVLEIHDKKTEDWTLISDFLGG